MKVIHRSEFRNAQGFISLGNMIRATTKRGSQWQRELAGEDRVADALGKLLDDRYTLIRNLVLPGDPYDLDMVLVGPAGVWEFEVLHFTGLVNTETGWMTWDFTLGQVRPVPRELVQRTQDKAARLAQYLAEQSLPVEVNQATILSTLKAPRDFAVPGLQVVFVEEMPGFIQTAMDLLKPAAPVPVEPVVARLAGVRGHETGEYAPSEVLGMTLTQFFIVLTLAVGMICVLLGCLAAYFYYQF
jgi:hypothetical protein